MRRVCTIVIAMSMGSSAAIAADDVLKVRLNADIRSLDPGVNRDGNTDAVQGLLFEGLVAFKEDTTVGPMLADSINVSDDGQTYTFVLRDGLKFSNGEPVTSADVLFSWERYTKPATGWRCLPDVGGHGAVHVTSVTSKDDRTIVFTLKEPSALFLTILARPDCGGTGIYHKSSVDSAGKWLKPVTTAPFKLGEWRHGEYIELERNDHYVARNGESDGYAGRKQVLVSKVRFLVVPDESTAKAAMLNGDLHINYDIENGDIAEYRANPNVVLESVPVMTINDFLIQTTDPVMQDVRIRRAFLLSLDMDELVAGVTSGTAQPNNSPIPPSSSFHGPAQSKVVKRDIEEAKKLLKEAGYDGKPIKMVTNKHYPAMYDSAVLAQAMAAEAGLNIELEVIDWGAQQDLYTSGKYQIMSHGFSARLDPSLSFDMFSGVKAKQPRKVWDNEKALALIAESMKVADKKVRQPIFDQLEDMFRQDIPMIVTYSTTQTSAVRSNVHGYKGWALGQPLLWNVSLGEK